MCGIIGQINFTKQKAPKLSLNKIHHRGPDGEGTWTNEEGNVFFGHTRLAILEPTQAGHQPMADTSKRFIITFNGEIYNHLHLRSFLPHIQWRGNSDTETLVELFTEKGMASLSLLQGMFAIALYDQHTNSVLLIRDRLGIKPLYIKISTETVAFASEVKALMQNGEEIVFAKEAFSQYVGFGHFPATGDVLNGIESIPPGGFCLIRENGKIENGSWWTLKKSSSRTQQTRKAVVSDVKTMVTRAIEDHLISDVGMASFLSGGVDSGIVSTVAGKALGKNLKTFTVGFPNNGNDERVIARKVAARIGSEHTEVVIDEMKCLQWVEQAVQSLDLPSVDAINTFIVSKAVKEAGAKVALSGLGGDELFGGYPAFKKVYRMRYLSYLPTSVVSCLGNKFSSKFREKYAGISSFSVEKLAVNYRRFSSIYDLQEMNLLDGTPYIPSYEDEEIIRKISISELYGYTIPMLLRDSDQMSMSLGLEIRVPFLDNFLVEAILNLPDKLKTRGKPKELLVEAFKKDLPVEVYSRKKQGFSLPMDTWMKGPLKKYTSEGIEAAASILHLNHPYNLQNTFYKGQMHWTRVWLWAVLGHWLQNQQITQPVPVAETVQ